VKQILIEYRTIKTLANSWTS